MRRFITLLLCLLSGLLTSHSAAAPGAPAVREWLSDAGAPRASVAVQVSDVDASRGARPLVSINSEQALNPASVIKLFTVWSALGILGSDYRWRTVFYLHGPLSAAGVLKGDLVIRGGGDPKLVIEDLTELIARMRAQGLQHIQGDLIVDDALYVVSNARGPSFDGQPSEPYNVRPNAAMMNFKSTKFTMRPAGKKVQVALDPPLANVAVDNQIKLVKGRCKHGASGIEIVEPGNEQQPMLRLMGRYSRGCREQSAYRAVLNHRQFIDGFFRAAWQAAGGTFAGQTKIRSGAVAKLAARGGIDQNQPWFVWESPRTLGEIATDINKFSNNVMTRQLVLHLAATSQAVPPDREQGLGVIAAWLTLHGLRHQGLVIDNGSGLSRNTRTTAAGLSALLVAAARSNHGAVLRESLPIVGRDGTMRWRLNKHPIAANAWIKTGSLDAVRAIAGYVRARSGRLLAVTMLVNGPGARRSQGAQDELLKWVYENG